MPTTLKVGQLAEHLAARDENSLTSTLGTFEVSDDASTLTVTKPYQETYALDEGATRALTRYLKIPTGYYQSLTSDFKATVLRYEMERKKEAATTIETLGSDIVAIHSPQQVMLPLTKVAQVITKTFAEDDTIRRIITSENLFHVDVTSTNHQVEFAPTPQSTALVGDITEAGIRFLAHPFVPTAPSVSLYAERLVCMNGQTTPEKLGRISLKGRTVDEVIQEMEEAAQSLLPDLDKYLDTLSSTRQLYPPGTPQAFAAQLAREHNLPRTVLDKVLDIVNQLPPPASLWDIQNAFTQVANQSQSYSTMTRLQTLGGELSFTPQQAIARCQTCEQRIA